MSLTIVISHPANMLAFSTQIDDLLVLLQSDTAVYAWPQVCITGLTEPPLQLRRHADLVFHGNLPCQRDISLRKACITYGLGLLKKGTDTLKSDTSLAS